MVRERVPEWDVLPNRVGFLSFSAGAIAGIEAAVCADFETMPDLLVAIYPAMRRIAVPKSAPPLFVAIAADDRLWPSHELDLVQA